MNFEENKTCCPKTNGFRQNLARLRGERLKPPLQTLIVDFINGHIFEKPLIVGLINRHILGKSLIVGLVNRHIWENMLIVGHTNRHILEKPLTILLTDGTL